MKINYNPSRSFEEVIKDPNLGSLSREIAEITIDKALNEGLLKDIPSVSIVLNSIKFVNSISKYFFAKKIYKFLFEIQDIPYEKRLKKVEQINNSKKYQSSVGEMVFEILENIESDIKPKIVGNLFSAFVEEKIDFQTFLKAAHIVKKIFIYDLIELKNNCDGKWVLSGVTDEIHVSGIVDVDFLSSYNERKSDEYFEKRSDSTLTEIGEIIIKIGMK